MYERNFGTDWETLDDRDQIIGRAFALGVAEELGEEYPGELDRLTEAAETTYDRSFVEIAYQKGRERAGATRPTVSRDEQVWEQLVEEKTTVDPDDMPDSVDLDETLGLPRPLRGLDIDTFYVDSTQRVRRPSFLERQRPKPRSDSDGNDRTDSDENEDDKKSSNWWDTNVKRDMASKANRNDDSDGRETN
ncbi:hypothetical protein [Natronobacterium texcoconense]|uniref:Uncharacterized protein n=1 Tax=Natronobacterium texcoconense TaxID=1095778 RepID=A0A1H1EDZ8_NATTX|nr:hypothetical protein [Natronobacterium texcoconense]SDQ86864.1 hypothetical protein SAMN04489842_1546 [Natronobacterium texcoconense]